MLSFRVAKLVVLRLICSTLGEFEHRAAATAALRVTVRIGGAANTSRKHIVTTRIRILGDCSVFSVCVLVAADDALRI